MQTKKPLPDNDDVRIILTGAKLLFNFDINDDANK